MEKAKNRKGQALLIAVMLLATIITVVMTVAFNATTETQITKLEADSQKALAAAEAGIDAVIKQSVNSTPINIGDLGQFGEQSISGTAQVTGVSTSQFITPLLQKDEQYTLYFSDYPGFSNPWSGAVSIALVSENGQCPAMEITIITSTDTIQKYAYNTCASIITNAVTCSHPGSPVSIDGISFEWYTPAVIPVTNGKVAFVKILNGKTKLGIRGYEADGVTPKDLALQGKTITSEARTASGVVKRVQLFQSFPQIPAAFFMTSF